MFVDSTPALPAWRGLRTSRGELPQHYNAAADLLSTNLAAGRRRKPAFIDARRAWSYGDLAERADRFGNVLRMLDVRREERILLCLLDDIDWPTTFLGAIKAGVVPVPVNTLLTTDDYRFMLTDSRARMLIVSESLYPKVAPLIGLCPDLVHVVVSGEDSHGHPRLEDLLQAAGDAAITAPTCRDEPCFWLYTSGSTGWPKAAVHVHGSLRLTEALYAAPILQLSETDVCYSVAKLFFAYGLGNALTFPMSAGATTVLLSERPTPELVGDLLRRHGITVFYGVPTFLAAFLACPKAPARDDVSIRTCVSAGEPLPAEIGRRFRDRYGVDVLDGLGSTEMLHIYLSNRPGAVKYGTSGKPIPGYDLRLVGDDGEPVAAGQMGELYVKGPTSAALYWNNREQSRATFLGDWTRSGDKYVVDADGYYVYCGRRDDMMKVGGIYVSPFEVEGVLLGHSAVLEAAVVGCPDQNGLIKPKAYVVLHDGKRAGDAMVHELQDHCRRLLAPFKYPHWVEFRSELPKTATGKIQRFRLRAESA